MDECTFSIYGARCQDIIGIFLVVHVVAWFCRRSIDWSLVSDAINKKNTTLIADLMTCIHIDIISSIAFKISFEGHWNSRNKNILCDDFIISGNLPGCHLVWGGETIEATGVAFD